MKRTVFALLATFLYTATMAGYTTKLSWRKDSRRPSYHPLQHNTNVRMSNKLKAELVYLDSILTVGKPIPANGDSVESRTLFSRDEQNRDSFCISMSDSDTLDIFNLEYENGNMSTSYSRHKEDGEWNIDEKLDFTYDNGILVEAIQSMYIDAGQWEPQYKTTYEYNADGKLITEISYDWEDNSTWFPSDKTEYSYSEAGNLVAETEYGNYSDLWEEQDKFLYTEDEAGLILSGCEMEYNSDDAKWDSVAKYNFSYDSYGQLITEEVAYFENEIWNNGLLKKYTYDYNKPAAVPINGEFDAIEPEYGNDYRIISFEFIEYEQDAIDNSYKEYYFYSDSDTQGEPSNPTTSAPTKNIPAMAMHQTSNSIGIVAEGTIYARLYNTAGLVMHEITAHDCVQFCTNNLTTGVYYLSICTDSDKKIEKIYIR